MATTWVAYTQIDADMAAATVASTVAARTASHDYWVGGEMDRRGVTLAWTNRLGWLADRAGDPLREPVFVNRIPAPQSGQGWPPAR